MNGQNTFTEKALTGRGDLSMVGEGYKLQEEVNEAFKKMQKAALKDGIQIQIVSAYRSFNRQKKIWNRKYNRFISKGHTPEESIQKIIEYSTLPGTSRHHWGTDIDIIDASVKAPKNLLIEKNYINYGVYAKMKRWMDTHSKSYGFYLVYTNNSDRKGFKFEPWHYSYMQISRPMLHEFLKIDLAYLFKAVDLKGTDYLTREFLKKYIMENIKDINTELK